MSEETTRSNPTSALPENHAASYVAEPLKLDNESAINWHDSADVIVVGYGGAGVCAALEAKAQGADVLALDRFEAEASRLRQARLRVADRRS